MADENSLDYEINIKTQATLANLEDLRKGIERVKAETVEASEAMNEGFALTSEAVKQTDKDLLGSAEAAKVYSTAVKELVAQQKGLNEEQKVIAESTITFMNAMKGINETVSRMEMQTATKNVQIFRQELDRVTQAAIELQKKTGESFDTVVNAIKREDASSIKGAASTDVYTTAKKNLNAELQKQIAVMNMLKGIDVGGARAEQQATVSFLNTMKGIQTTVAQMPPQVSGLAGAFSNLRTSISNLGTIAQAVFGGIFAIGIVQAIRQVTTALIDFSKEILSRGKEMSQTMFTFEVSIRALQRIGLDTTIAGWSKEIDNLKKKFPFFSRKEFIEATTLAALMTREFGFTTEQIARLTEQAVVLAQITGKTLTESIRGVSYAIGSGYFESLQRAGINISRQIVAEEALARG